VGVGGRVDTTAQLPAITNNFRTDFIFSNRGELATALYSNGFKIGAQNPNSDTLSSDTSISALSFGALYTGASNVFTRSREILGLTTAGTGVQAVGLVGQFNTTPTALTNGQYGRAQLDANGYLLAVGGGFSPTNTFTPTAVAYSAGAVIQGARTLATAGPNAGGRMVILGARLLIPITAVPAGMTSFTLQLYSVTPPSALANNTTWDLPSGDNVSYLGSVALGTPVDLGSTLYVEQIGINKPLTVPSGGSVFAYLVTAGAYTATAVAYTVTLDLAAL
jgi:hypothetical protein